MNKKYLSYIALIIIAIMLFTGCSNETSISTETATSAISQVKETIEPTKAPTAEPTASVASPAPTPTEQATSFDLGSIPAYSGNAYIKVNNNVPYFTVSDRTTKAFENYSSLDSLGRCGVAYANVCVDIMPTEERGNIGQVKPSGWHTVKYDNVDGKYLYNRCHLIGYQLSAENANKSNLITGTRYLNINGMLPFENMVADYVKETHNHVLYRVTPSFAGNNLVAVGVLMEAMSVEDNGAGISYNVFCYNVQPGVGIDYATGDSWLTSGSSANTSAESSANASANTQNQVQSGNQVKSSYIGNINTKKFHRPDCSSVKKMKESSKDYMNCTRDQAIANGYEPCKNCNP